MFNKFETFKYQDDRPGGISKKGKKADIMASEEFIAAFRKGEQWAIDLINAAKIVAEQKDAETVVGITTRGLGAAKKPNTK